MVSDLPVDDLTRAKSLLRLLWIKYDAAGISMGRSYESVLLESALKLMDIIDQEELPECTGELVNETRNYLSSQMAASIGVTGLAKPPFID